MSFSVPMGQATWPIGNLKPPEGKKSAGGVPEVDRTLEAAGSDVHSIRREVNREERLLPALQTEQLPPGLDIHHTDSIVLHAPDKPLAILTEHHRVQIL